MKKNYFVDCGTLEELKALYKKLVFELHPDLTGSDGEEFKAMQNDYEKALEDLTTTWNFQNVDKESKNFRDDHFAEVLCKIIEYENLKIEIIGQWIWCFNSKEYHEQLKELGFWFSASKKAWVYSGSPKIRKYRSHNSVQDLRDKWGSEEIETNKKSKLA